MGYKNTATYRTWRKNNTARLREYHRRWRLKNRARWLAVCRKWRKKNPKKSRAIKARWRKKNPGKIQELRRAWYRKHRQRHVEYARDSRRRLSYAVFKIYGGKCACCGERELRFLTLDHVKNNGGQERRHGLKNNQLYRLIRNTGKRMAGIQVLCANCNLGKQWNAGVCPHATSSPR